MAVCRNKVRYESCNCLTVSQASRRFSISWTHIRASCIVKPSSLLPVQRDREPPESVHAQAALLGDFQSQILQVPVFLTGLLQLLVHLQSLVFLTEPVQLRLHLHVPVFLTKLLQLRLVRTQAIRIHPSSCSRLS